MLWKLFRIQNFERLWIPAVGQTFLNKVQQPALRPVRLRVYRNSRYY